MFTYFILVFGKDSVDMFSLWAVAESTDFFTDTQYKLGKQILVLDRECNADYNWRSDLVEFGGF